MGVPRLAGLRRTGGAGGEGGGGGGDSTALPWRLVPVWVLTSSRRRVGREGRGARQWCEVDLACGDCWEGWGGGRRVWREFLSQGRIWAARGFLARGVHHRFLPTPLSRNGGRGRFWIERRRVGQGGVEWGALQWNAFIFWIGFREFYDACAPSNSYLYVVLGHRFSSRPSPERPSPSTSSRQTPSTTSKPRSRTRRGFPPTSSA